MGREWRTGYGADNEALRMGKPAATDRPRLTPLNHSFTLDAILVCRQSAEQALEAFAAIASRMGLTINREKTRITKLTEGFDFIGFQFVKRRSPKTGKWNIYIFPALDENL
jgi:hypothetical protein